MKTHLFVDSKIKQPNRCWLQVAPFFNVKYSHSADYSGKTCNQHLLANFISFHTSNDSFNKSRGIRNIQFEPNKPKKVDAEFFSRPYFMI